MYVRKENGVTILSLVVTIIIVIILAVIAMFLGTRDIDRTVFAKFTSEFADYGNDVIQEYADRKRKAIMQNDSTTDKQIYYMIASGTEVTSDEEVQKAGDIADLGVEIFPDPLRGEEYYLIIKDEYVNKRRQKAFYEDDEKHYVTDGGISFILPGFLLEQEDGTQRWYVNERQYYVGSPIYGE